jgi:hypothetical protein
LEKEAGATKQYKALTEKYQYNNILRALEITRTAENEQRLTNLNWRDSAEQLHGKRLERGTQTTDRQTEHNFPDVD